MSVAHSLPPGHSQYWLRHLPNDVLVSNLRAALAREHATTAVVLAHIAEIDRRRLFVPAGYPSMRAYCLGVLHLSEDAASKRIQAARVARGFPAIFDAVADGRLHLSAAVLLAPHLKEGTPQDVADELIAVATHKSKAQIEVLLAHRFPQQDAPTRLDAVSPPAPPLVFAEHAPGHAGNWNEPGGSAPPPAAPPRVKPLAPERFLLQVTIGEHTHETLREVQALLSHRIPSGDIAEVLDLALTELKYKLQKRKFAATDRPRSGRARSEPRGRHIPAHVRRAVHERDGDRCTFVSDWGHRCESRKFLELDHIVEFARGGAATVENLRLRCRVHNCHTAEQTFGADFMKEKREAAQRAAEVQRRTRENAADDQARAETEARAEADADASRAQEADVVPWLRALGYRAGEAREAAKLCDAIPGAPLEERVKRALSFFRPRGTVRVPAPSP